MTDLQKRAVTLADADGTAPDVAEIIHDLLDALKAALIAAALVIVPLGLIALALAQCNHDRRLK